jgi:hypothetical protein
MEPRRRYLGYGMKMEKTYYIREKLLLDFKARGLKSN